MHDKDPPAESVGPQDQHALSGHHNIQPIHQHQQGQNEGRSRRSEAAAAASESFSLSQMFSLAPWWLRGPSGGAQQNSSQGGHPRLGTPEGTPQRTFSLGLGAPETGLGLRWFVSGWRRGTVPSNKFNLRPFAVAQQMGFVDAASCPFCAERRISIRFLSEEKQRRETEEIQLIEAAHPALRETLKTYVENNAKKGGPHNHSDALKQVLKGPTQILGAAAAAAASAAASAAAAAAGALSDVLAGASCRAPLNRSDLDELLPGQCSSWDEAAATAAAATEATPAAAAATPAETITTPSSAAQASTSSRFGAPRTLQRRAPLEAPGGLMAAAASLMSFGLSMQLPRPQKSDTRGPLRAPTPVGSQPLESGKDALCLRCKDTAAEVALLEEEVDEAERRCLLAIQFLSDSAEIIEELITSSQEAADSSSSSSSSSRCCSSESTCDSEAPHEDEPKVNKLRGDLLFATGPRQRRRQEQQQQ